MWVLNLSGILIKMGNLDTDMKMERTSYKDRHRDLGDVSTSQGAPKFASKLSEAMEGMSKFSLIA